MQLFNGERYQSSVLFVLCDATFLYRLDDLRNPPFYVSAHDDIQMYGRLCIIPHKINA